MSCALHRSSGSLFWQLKECSGAEIQVMVLEHRLQAGPLHPCSRDVKIPKKAVEAAAEKAAELIPLRLAGVPEHFNLPWILGLERRAFVRAGIDLKWRTVPEGTGAMCKLMRAGELDLAIMVTEGAVRDILQGNAARIIAQYVDSPLTWGVHVGAGTSIMDRSHLNGLPFCISRPNSGSHLAAKAYARSLGRNVSDEELVIVNDLKGAEARAAEPAPALFLWEKYTTKPLVDRGVLRCVDEYASPWPSFVIVATEAALAAHAGPIKRLLKVIRDQAAGLMQKKTAPAMIAHRYGMSLEDATAWFQGVRWNVGAEVDLGMLAAVTNGLNEAGLLEAALDPTACGERLVARI